MEEQNNNCDAYTAYHMEFQVHQQREKVSYLDLETARVRLETVQAEQEGQTERTKLEFEFKNRQLELEKEKLRIGHGTHRQHYSRSF
jgi:uncharacterized protein YqiB (DUF1249 family)